MKALLIATFVLAGSLEAQTDVRARLEARGLPSELVEQVSALAADATAQGLPSEPLTNKAIEGFAKQVPVARIVAALREYGARMLESRTALREAGLAAPSGEIIAAAADAMGRGLQPVQVGLLARAAPSPGLVSPGLTVAAALTAQGMPAQRAVAVVTDAMRSGRSSSQILDLPATAQAMQLHGMTPDQAGERLLRGGQGGGPGGGPGNEGFGRGQHGQQGQSGDGRGGPGPGPPPPRPPHSGDRPGGNQGPGGDRPTRP